MRQQILYSKYVPCSADFLNHETFERYMQRELGPYKTEYHVREERRIGERHMEMKYSCTVWGGPVRDSYLNITQILTDRKVPLC